MNDAKTKLKKNYLALVIVLAVLGVIGVALISIYSFADEDDVNNSKSQYTYHITGKVYDPLGNIVKQADVDIYSYDFIAQSQLTKDDGTFDFTIVVDSEFYTLGKISIMAQGFGPRMYYDKVDFSVISSDIMLGDITLSYVTTLAFSVNGSRSELSTYGDWYKNGEPLFSADGNGGGVDILYFGKTANYSLENNKVVVNFDASFISPSGTNVYEYIPKAGHSLSWVTVSEQAPNYGSTPIVSAELFLDAVIDNPGPVPPVPSMYTVTFGENISKVLANGVEITSGAEVEEGTSLQIVPAFADKKVTKVYVNDSVCPLCQTTVNSNINIEGQMYNSVKLTGRVLADNEKQTNALKTISKAFIDTAYAAEVGVDGAVITFTDATDGWYTSAVSDSNGEFELDVVKGNAGMLTVSKEGYENYTKDINADDLSEGYVINPVLKVVNVNPENNPSKDSLTQTGDSLQVLTLLFIIAVIGSCIFLYRRNYKIYGKHVK